MFRNKLSLYVIVGSAYHMFALMLPPPATGSTARTSHGGDSDSTRTSRSRTGGAQVSDARSFGVS